MQPERPARFEAPLGAELKEEGLRDISTRVSSGCICSFNPACTRWREWALAEGLQVSGQVSQEGLEGLLSRDLGPSPVPTSTLHPSSPQPPALRAGWHRAGTESVAG